MRSDWIALPNATHNRSRAWLSLIAAIALVATACGAPDGPLGPDELRPTTVAQARVVTLSEGGQSYTLDLDSRELRDGTGRTIELTNEQMGQFATLYDEVLYTQYLDARFEAEGQPPQPMCGANPCQPELRAATPIDREGLRKWIFAGGRIKVWHDVKRRGRSPSAGPSGVVGNAVYEESLTPRLNFEDPPSCWGLATAI